MVKKGTTQGTVQKSLTTGGDGCVLIFSVADPGYKDNVGGLPQFLQSVVSLGSNGKMEE